MLSVVLLFVGAAALTLLCCAALQDMRERLIANRFSVLLLPLGLAHHAVLAESLADWLSLTGVALVLALGALLVGFLLWRLGSLGGGDVKLLVATLFFVGADGAAPLLVGTALFGGVLALGFLAVARLLRSTSLALGQADLDLSARDRRSIPYGVAIASGAALVIVPSLPPLIG